MKVQNAEVVLTKEVKEGRLLIKYNNEVIVNLKVGSVPTRNIRQKLIKMGLSTDFKVVDEVVETEVYVSKKDAKVGDKVLLFGKPYKAYLKEDGKLGFNKL